MAACALRCGAAKRAAPSLTHRLDQLLNGMPVLPPDSAVDRHYAEMRTGLNGSDEGIAGNDRLIDARDRALNFALATSPFKVLTPCNNNKKSFWPRQHDRFD